MPRMRMNQAIVAALHDEMKEDSSVIVFGEDVAEAGGPFKTSDGLLATFGASRVRDTPISEMAFLGAAVGAAATGLRPVVEIMFVEFLGVALDQLTTEAAKFHYLSNGQIKVPITVRASIGAGLGFGCQHSQTMETWMMGTPGLKLVVPSGPQSAYGLLRAAIRDNNPVVVLEPRVLYAQRAEVKTGVDQIIRIGEASIVAEGEDVTIVALGSTVGTAIEAASKSEWSATIVDLQSLVPWDVDAVEASVRQTGRLVIVEENPYSGGWGADIAAEMGTRMFRKLAAPILRITSPDVPVPFGKELENWYRPNATYVARQVTEYLKRDTIPPHWWEGQR